MSSGYIESVLRTVPMNSQSCGKLIVIGKACMGADSSQVDLVVVVVLLLLEWTKHLLSSHPHRMI